MDRLKKLVEEQQRLWTRMQEIQRAAEEGEGRDWTAEERTNWDTAEKRLNEVSGDIERLERAAKLEVIDRGDIITATGDGSGGDGKPPAGGDDAEKRTKAAYAEAFDVYMRRGMSRCSDAQQRLLEENYVAEERAQGAGTDAAGGYLVPEGFRNVMTESMKAFGGLMNLAEVITTTTGNPLPWPTSDDTNNVGAILGENTQIGEQDLLLGQSQLGAYTYTSKLVRVSWQLLQDSAFDLNAWLPRKLGERIGRAQAPHLVSGTGTGQPTGLASSAIVGVTGTGTTAITYDNLIDLEHSIDPAYRTNARYVLSDGALKTLRKIKDADNRPLWVPVPAPGFPATINGFPYTVDNSMAAPGASARSILFGDIRAGFIIRVVQGVQMVRLQERYADFLQTGFFGFARMDAKPDDPSAVRAFAHAAV